MIHIVIVDKYKVLDILDISNYRGSYQYYPDIVLSGESKTNQNNNNIESSKKI